MQATDVKKEPGMVVHINAQVLSQYLGGSGVQSHLWLYIEFKTSLGYMSPYFKKQNKNGVFSQARFRSQKVLCDETLVLPSFTRHPLVQDALHGPCSVSLCTLGVHCWLHWDAMDGEYQYLHPASLAEPQEDGINVANWWQDPYQTQQR